MDALFYVFAGATAIAAALATIAIWAPRPTRVRVLALAIAVLFLPTVYVQTTELLSRPKPMSFEWYQRDTAKAALLGVSFDEGQSIYLWLMLADSVVPRSYVVPWNLRLAERLEDAVEAAVIARSTVVIDNPFQRRSLDDWGDLNVDVILPPVPPMKKPPPPARIFNPRGQSI